MLLNTAKYHCYSFYRFGSIKGKPTGGGGGGKITQKLAPPTFIQIQVKHASEKSRKIPLVNIVAEEDVLKYH